MAPEIHIRQLYQGEQVDLFAAAIILFIMVTKHIPFGSATPGDFHYNLIAQGRYDDFWIEHFKLLGSLEHKLSDSFKNLITNMFSLDPTDRLSMEQILDHQWMQGEIPCDREVRAELEIRMKELN